MSGGTGEFEMRPVGSSEVYICAIGMDIQSLLMHCVMWSLILHLLVHDGVL